MIWWYRRLKPETGSSAGCWSFKNLKEASELRNIRSWWRKRNRLAMIFTSSKLAKIKNMKTASPSTQNFVFILWTIQVMKFDKVPLHAQNFCIMKNPITWWNGWRMETEFLTKKKKAQKMLVGMRRQREDCTSNLL